MPHNIESDDFPAGRPDGHGVRRLRDLIVREADGCDAAGFHPPHDLIPLIAPARREPFDDGRTRDAKNALLPAAASASRRRQSLAVQSSARARVAVGTSAPGAGAFGRGAHVR